MERKFGVGIQLRKISKSFYSTIFRHFFLLTSTLYRKGIKGHWTVNIIGPKVLKSRTFSPLLAYDIDTFIES